MGFRFGDGHQQKLNLCRIGRNVIQTQYLAYIQYPWSVARNRAQIVEIKGFKGKMNLGSHWNLQPLPVRILIRVTSVPFETM